MKQFISREILVSFALGGVPTAVTYGASDETKMLTRLTSLKPSDEIFLCLIGFLLAHLAVYLINKWWLKLSDRTTSIINYIHGVTEQIGFGIHGIYRTITGAVPMSLGILIYHHGSSGAAQATALSIILVPGSLFICCLLSWINENTKRRRSFL